MLAASNAPLIASFLYERFVRPNVRSALHHELASQLADHVHLVRQITGKEDGFRERAEEYLDEWASTEHGWLRRYYPPNSDEPCYDMTAAAGKAVEWLTSLEKQEFIGIESRLNTVLALLREIAEKTNADPSARIAELEKRKAQIDVEIRRIRDGHIPVMEPVQVKERFLQMVQTARALLADFREMEQNFRALDRAIRERIAAWEGTKGELLGDVLGERDAIAESDQGKSFHAFWDFLMSPIRQDEFTSLLAAAFVLDPVQELTPDPVCCASITIGWRRARRRNAPWRGCPSSSAATSTTRFGLRTGASCR